MSFQNIRSIPHIHMQQTSSRIYFAHMARRRNTIMMKTICLNQNATRRIGKKLFFYNIPLLCVNSHVLISNVPARVLRMIMVITW